MCHLEDEITKVSAFLLRYLQLIMVLKCDISYLTVLFSSSAASEREGGNMIKICLGSSAGCDVFGLSKKCKIIA